MGTKAKGEVGGTICAAGTNSRASGVRGIATATAKPLQLLSVAPVVSRDVLYGPRKLVPTTKSWGGLCVGIGQAGPFLGTAARAGRSARVHLHQVALPEGRPARRVAARASSADGAFQRKIPSGYGA